MKRRRKEERRERRREGEEERGRGGEEDRPGAEENKTRGGEEDRNGREEERRSRKTAGGRESLRKRRIIYDSDDWCKGMCATLIGCYGLLIGIMLENNRIP